MRHGHTAWNRAGRLQGRVDERLDDTAIGHLTTLRLPEEFAAAAVYASPLMRAVETARIVAGREPVLAPELIEMDWGEFEGKRGVDLIEDPHSGYRHIEHWGWHFRPPGGESPYEVWNRLQPWLRGLTGAAVAVTHVGVIRVLLARACSWDFEGQPPFRVKRDRLYRLRIHSDGSLSHDNDPIRLPERRIA